ncbi:MAG: ABC transporter ATP-binding protein [Candidatus Aminicenantales bacterium]|jgi:ABC-2 type transport system ATP-binding protein
MLELRGVTKKYSAIPAVRDVSFVLKPGEITGYLGPNGAGKSTTIKMMAGLLEPTEGEILYQGHPIRQNMFAYKSTVGYVPEQSDVYKHMSAWDYLFMVGRLRGLSDLLLQTKVTELMQLLGLSSEMDMAMASYSKGMVQKVLLASALLHDPRVILMDEPLSGLDVTTALVVKDLLALLAQEGKIIIYSSHVLEVVEKVCSRVIIIDKGIIAADDSVENLSHLMNLPSLEEIFSRLVVSENPEITARGIAEAIKRGS